MFIRFLACAWALLCALTASAEITQLPTPRVDYAADRELETESGTFGGKVYVSAGKERTELETAGMQTVMILRPDLELGWMLMPAQRMYQQLDFGKARQQAGGPAPDVKISYVGEDTVEGHATKKYKLLMKDGSAGGFMWFTDDGIAVKMDLLMKEGRKKSRMTMTLKNLQVGPQDPAHFELPKGYAKMPSGGMFGALGGGGTFGAKSSGPAAAQPTAAGATADAGATPANGAGATPPGEKPARERDPGLVDAAADGAKSGLRSGVASGVAAGVAEGIRGLFRR